MEAKDGGGPKTLDDYGARAPMQVPQADVMDFGDALNALKSGLAVARVGWNGRGMWLRLQRPDAHSKMTLPYIYIEYPAGHPAYPAGARVPWLASQTDMLALDWVLVAVGDDAASAAPAA